MEYGDLVRFDFGADAATCIRCDFQLSAASEDFRTGTLVHDAALHSVGPVRGEGYASGEVRLIRYYCPGCGRQLEAEVSVGPGRSAFLVRPGGTQAAKGAIK